MRYLLIVLITALLCFGCAQTYTVPSGQMIVIQFVDNEQTVSDLYFRFRPVDRGLYKQIRGFYIEDFKVIIVAANPCDPEVLSHELLHFLGQHQIDDYLSR